MKKADSLVLTLMVLAGVSLYVLWPSSGGHRTERSKSDLAVQKTTNAASETQTSGPVEVKHGFSFEISKDSKNAPKLETFQTR